MSEINKIVRLNNYYTKKKARAETVMLEGIRCSECGHTWVPRKGKPRYCPKCLCTLVYEEDIKLKKAVEKTEKEREEEKPSFLRPENIPYGGFGSVRW